MTPPIHIHTGTAVCLPGDDIDTDRILPARFLKATTFEGLAEQAFYDERFHEDGTPKPHPLSRFPDASVVLTGRNFGCGSSREHAPQALYRRGIRAMVGLGFAEIFSGNALALGMICATVTPEVHAALCTVVCGSSSARMTVDVAASRVSAGGASWAFSLDETARNALMQGRYDPLDALVERLPQVRHTARGLFYMGFRTKEAILVDH